MKQIAGLAAMTAVLLYAVMVHGQTDFSSIIVGRWKFDMGAGIMAAVEYRKDGSFQQTVDEMIIGGTYRVKGRKLKTISKGQATMYTLVSLVGKELTVKRDKDGRTIVYIRQ